MQNTIEPAIHYWGTPVVLISTLNENGSANLAPMSSAWWLGYSCMLGLDASSQTTLNLKRERECVLNLPSADLAPQVNRLALLTGSKSVPMHKRLLNYRFEEDKFGAAGFTAKPSLAVKPPAAAECPVQLEAVVENVHAFAARDDKMAIPSVAVEVRIVKVHASEEILQANHENRINPDEWHPLIMSFRKFYGYGASVEPSRLAEGPEENYAPWKFGGIKAWAAKMLSAYSRAKYAHRSEAAHESRA